MILYHTNFNTFQSPPDPLLAFIMSTLHFYHFWGLNITFSFFKHIFHVYISFHIYYHHFIYHIIISYLMYHTIISYTIFFVIYHIISYNILSFRISYHHLTHISFYHIIKSSFYISYHHIIISDHNHFTLVLSHILSSYHHFMSYVREPSRTHHFIQSYRHVFPFLSYIIS